MLIKITNITANTKYFEPTSFISLKVCLLSKQSSKLCQSQMQVAPIMLGFFNLRQNWRFCFAKN